MVNQTNKQTFAPPLVGEVSNLAGVKCPINSKVYHSLNIWRLAIHREVEDWKVDWGIFVA